jgi:hypothetical protein
MFLRRVKRGFLWCLVFQCLFLGSAGALASTSLPVNLEPPSVAGITKSGQTLSVSAGSWSGDPFAYSYLWEKCNVEASACAALTDGATGPSYLLGPKNVGSKIRVKVWARNSAGLSHPAVSAIGEKVKPAWENVHGPPKVEEVPWHPLRSSLKGQEDRVLVIWVSTGYCYGEPPPRFDHVKVAERQKTVQHPSGSAVIRAFIRFPAPTEVVGTVGPGEPGPICMGIGTWVRHRVRLKRPVLGLPLFDGSYSPPKRVDRR